MKSILKLSLVLVVLFQATFLLSSCSSDDEGPSGEFATGVFVVNEGNFQDSDGTISHYNENTNTATSAIFSTTNSGAILGDVVQSMTIDNNLAYIVVNNSNKVEVVNSNTFEREYTIDGLLLPRYFLAHNGKGYISEWVSFSDKGRVSVLDMATRTIETTIETDIGAEFILEVGGSIYVSNSFTTNISVIDPESNTVTATIDLDASVTQMVVDRNQKVWAISGGSTDFNVSPPVPNNDGKLVRIDPTTNTVEAEILLNTNATRRLVTNSDGSELLILIGNSVFNIPVDGASGTLTALVDEANAIGFYGIGVDPDTDIIYVGDARGFQGNGTVYRYAADGTFIDTFSAGRGPNGFVFN